MWRLRFWISLLVVACPINGEEPWLYEGVTKITSIADEETERKIIGIHIELVRTDSDGNCMSSCTNCWETRTLFVLFGDENMQPWQIACTWSIHKPKALERSLEGDSAPKDKALKKSIFLGLHSQGKGHGAERRHVILPETMAEELTTLPLAWKMPPMYHSLIYKARPDELRVQP